MKKIFALFCVCMICSGAVWGVEAERLLTDGYFNGRVLSDPEIDRVESMNYIHGVTQTLFFLPITNKVMKELYPDSGDKEIAKAVTEYYRKNPEQNDRSIIDVVLTGCK